MRLSYRFAENMTCELVLVLISSEDLDCSFFRNRIACM